jgi:putative transcriptional regulator
LAEYAVGALPRPLHALIGGHLDLNPSSERFVAQLESLHGAELQRAAPRPVAGRERMLSAIFAQEPEAADDTASVADPVFTASIREFIGMASHDVPWRSVLPGVKEYVVSDANGVEAKLFWIKAGRKIPSHTHDGQEITLVLQGGFTDISGHYARGDVAIADEDLDHKPVADDHGEDCICLAVTDAPLRLTGPVGKIFQTIFRN